MSHPIKTPVRAGAVSANKMPFGAQYSTPVCGAKIQTLTNLMQRALAFDGAMQRNDLYLIGTRNGFTEAQARRAVDVLAERGTAQFRFNDDGSVTVCVAGGEV